MIRYNFETAKFKGFLSTNEESIKKRIGSAIIDDPKFAILKSQYLDQLWMKHRHRKYIFEITVEEIKRLDFSMTVSDFLENSIKMLYDNNIVRIGSKLELISCEEFTGDLRQYCINDTVYDCCVFYFDEDGILIYHNGNVISSSSLFYKEIDLVKYSGKMNISQIGDFFLQYRESLLDNESRIFFESSAKIATIRPDNTNVNILVHSPERLMISHLVRYLNSYFQHTFSVNMEIPDTTLKIDICTEVEGKSYFFKIMWLGESISNCGTRIDEPKTGYDARCGVTKVLECAKLLKSKESNIEKGFLVIYDARTEVLPIDFCNYSFVDIELKDYLSYLETVDNLRIQNKISA